MPKVTIKGVGDVNFPDSMTPEQIQSAIENDVLPQIKSQPSAAQSQEWIAQEPPGVLERIGYGAQKQVDRISQLTLDAGEKLGLVQPGLADLATQRMNQEHADFEHAQRNDDVPAMRYDRLVAPPMAGGDKYGRKQVDLAEIAGSAGMQSPLALLPSGGSLLGRAFWGGVQGGASGALQYDSTNTLSQGAKNSAAGAIAGAVIAPAVGYLTDKTTEAAEKSMGRVKGAQATISGSTSDEAIKKAVPELQQLPADAQDDLISEARAQIRKTGDISAEQLSRKANLLANKVKPTKAMITRSPQDWAVERNLSKMTGPDHELQQIGGALTDTYKANDVALRGQLYGLSENIPKATQEGYGMQVMKSLDDLANSSQEEVSKAYDAVRQLHGDKAATTGESVLRVLKDPDIVDNVDSESILKSITARLKRYGAVNAAGESTGKALTVNQAEEFRKFVRGLGSSPNTHRIAKQFMRAIDEDVLGGVSAESPVKALELEAQAKGLFGDNTSNEMLAAEKEWMQRYQAAKAASPKLNIEPSEDFFANARTSAKERFSMLENPATQKALNTYGELVQGKTAQNFIKSQVIDAPVQDVKSLLGTISKIADPAKKQQALESMKGGVFSYLEGEAINRNSGQFSGAALNKALTELGDDKLGLVLGADELAKLKSLSQAALDVTYQPPYAAVNASNTTPAALSLTRTARRVFPVPLPFLNEAAEQEAARSGYQKQLAEALKAQIEGELPQLPPALKQSGKVLKQLGIPASQALLDQKRNPPNKNAEKRNAKRD